ncbi:SigE family RNA polymerase sigma factor [Nocardioides sp. zg-536]|uniref:SigE family RNA polymerase sigma factor n=1 Tax=Nocardioides faecalis TaxID=2803858 RepID=A0A939BUU2_9ACTN|nr:SigE family RNA polymerase sigma factor [Nocardioides faecalis]MBM9458847.1 SigE family RNA polymerase sigma factor [Nocardioides faecalis]QVI60253.1 SigE family RNA polymerase sigma factor [Nocardioides faecalis]
MRAQREAEFTAFVQQSGTQLYRAALLLTGDHHLAEDLTQTTYAKVFAQWRRVRATDNPVGYARTTLLNTFLSQRRLRRSGEQPTATVSDTASYDVDAGTRLDLLTALATLSPLDRAVVVLRYWEDRSVAAVAIDLGLTEDVVRTRSRRALQRLRPLVSTPERTL